MKLVVLLFALFLVSSVSARTLSFHGHPIGGFTTPDQIVNATGADCGTGANGGDVCNGYTKVAGALVNLNAVIAPTGRLVCVFLWFTPDDFDTVVHQFIADYGKPQLGRMSILQNVLGQKFLQIEYVWTAPNGAVLYLMKYSGTSEDSIAQFSMPGGC